MKEIIQFLNDNPILTALAGIIVPAVVAFIVARVQAKSSEKQLDKQLKTSKEELEIQIIAESEKIKYQYELEQKRNDINFLNKLKLEKLTTLYELVARKTRYIVRININAKKLLRSKKLEELTEEEINAFVERRSIIEKEEFDDNLTREISITMCYFPILNKEWERIISVHHKVIDLYIDQILGLLKIQNEEDFSRKLPSNYTVNKYLIDITNSENDFVLLISKIGIEIQTIMTNLEHNYEIKK